MTKEKTPVDGKTEIECQDKLPARRTESDNSATGEHSVALFAAKCLSTKNVIKSCFTKWKIKFGK